MKKEYIIGGICIIAVIVIAMLFGGKVDITTGMRNTSGQQYIHLNQTQNIVSVSYDGEYDIFTTDSAHSLVIGDVIRPTTASAAFGGDDAPGFSENTNYFVVTATSSTTFEISTTKGGTVLDIATAASAGGGEFFTEEKSGTAFPAGNYPYVTFSLDAEEVPSIAFKFVGSIQETEPNWYASQSQANQYEYIGVFDVATQTEIEGDTGLTFSGTDDHRTFEVYANVLNWITVITQQYASGSVTVRILGGE